MADGDRKMVSPRGAFFVGLSVGLGVAIVLYVFQTERLKNEVNHLREDLALEHTRYRLEKFAPPASPAPAPEPANK